MSACPRLSLSLVHWFEVRRLRWIFRYICESRCWPGIGYAGSSWREEPALRVSRTLRRRAELVDRCIEKAVANRFIQLMSDYSSRAKAVGSGFDMNPSPGNIRDGLVADAMKSAGAA